MLGTRVTRVVTVLLTTVALGLAPTACGLSVASRDGIVDEVERGRNGKKVEVVSGDGDDHDEWYLLPGSPCQKGDRLRDCADADDYLKPVPGARPGLNR